MAKKKTQEAQEVQELQDQPQEEKKPTGPYIYLGPTTYKEKYFLTHGAIFKEIPQNLDQEDRELFYLLSDYAKSKDKIDEEVMNKLKEREKKKEESK